jgi:hypothetical protein
MRPDSARKSGRKEVARRQRLAYANAASPADRWDGQAPGLVCEAYTQPSRGRGPGDQSRARRTTCNATHSRPRWPAGPSPIHPHGPGATFVAAWYRGGWPSRVPRMPDDRGSGALEESDVQRLNIPLASTKSDASSHDLRQICGVKPRLESAICASRRFSPSIVARRFRGRGASFRGRPESE